MKILFPTVILALFLLVTPAIDACSCARYATVCDSYQKADAVFIGVVQSVNNKLFDEYSGQVAHIQIEKSFKGMAQPEVIFRTEGSSCDKIYKEGQRWLFYAYYDQKTKRWNTAACDRSTTIDEAGDDLLYLQGLPKSASTTRLSGELTDYEDDPEKGFTRVKNIIGAKVKITGEGKDYEVYTDTNGVFEILGLPPGKYSVEPEIPPGLKLRFPIPHGAIDLSDRTDPKLILILKEKSCASIDFVLGSNTRNLRD